MIRVSNIDGLSTINNLQSFTFQFEFDNASTLPVRTYQLGLSTYIIANGSTAKNIKNNSIYEYQNGMWNKVSNDSNNTDSNSITKDGNYSIVNNSYSGNSNIEVKIDSPTPPTPPTPVTGITITKQPDSTLSAYWTEEFQLSVEATAPEGVTLSYQWYVVPDANSPDKYYKVRQGGTTNVLTYRLETEGYHGITGGYFFCRVSDASGTLPSVDSNHTVVTLLFPNITYSNYSPSVAHSIIVPNENETGIDVTLSVDWTSECANDRLVRVEWYINPDGESWVRFPLATTDSSTITLTNQSTAYPYFIRCLAITECTDFGNPPICYSQAWVFTNESNPIVIKQPTPYIETYLGRDWAVSATSFAPEGTELEYQWYFDHNEVTAIPGATSSTLTANFFDLAVQDIIILDIDTEGNIIGALYCVVSDASGTLDSVTSDSVHFKALTAVATITSQTPSTASDIPATIGDSLTFSFTWSSTDPQDDTGIVIWNKVVGSSTDVIDTTTVPTLTWTVDEDCEIYATLITRDEAERNTDPWTITVN